MDPRRGYWEEDVTRPLLSTHDEDRPTAGELSWSGLRTRLICWPVDLGGHPAVRNMLGVLAWVFLWWIADAVPLAVASMAIAPLFLFRAFGISSDDVAKAYKYFYCGYTV